jgi:hypothetical protein
MSRAKPASSLCLRASVVYAFDQSQPQRHRDIEKKPSVFSRKSGGLLVRLKQKSYRPKSPFSVTLRD